MTVVIKPVSKKTSGSFLMGERRDGDDISGGEAFFTPLYEQQLNRETNELAWRAVTDPSASFDPHGRIKLPNPDEQQPRFLIGRAKPVPFLKSHTERWFNFAFDDQPTPLIQSISLSDRSASSLRTDLTGEGLQLDAPVIGEISVQLSDREHIVIGQLEENPAKPGFWRLPENGNRIFRTRIGRPSIQSISIGDHHISAWVDRSNLRDGPEVDWRSDEAIVDAALDWLGTTNADVAENASVIEAVTSLVAKAAQGLNPAVRVRFIELCETFQASTNHRDEIVRLLASRTDVKQRQRELVEAAIDQEKATRIGEIEAAARARAAAIESELSDRETRIRELRADRSRVTEEIDNRLRAFEALSATVETRTRQLEIDMKRSHDLAESLNQRIQTAAASAVAKHVEDAAQSAVLRFAADLDILKTLGITREASDRQSTEQSNRARQVARTEHFTSLPDSVALSSTSPDRLWEIVRPFAKSLGISPTDVRRVLTALMAGLAPIIHGSGAVRSLQAIANGLMNGACLVVPISPTSLEPADILGRFNPSLGVFMPEPYGLSDLLLTARRVPHPILVIFEGVNRAPLESIFMPFVELFTDPESRHMRCLHRGLVKDDDPFAGLADITWPENLLLAGTVVDGAATLPLGASWTPACCLLNEVNLSNRASPLKPERSWLTTVDWLKIQAETSTSDPPTNDLLFGIDVKTVPSDLKAPAHRLQSVDESLVSPPSDRPLVDGLLPWLVARDLGEVGLGADFDDQFDLNRAVSHLNRLIHGKPS